MHSIEAVFWIFVPRSFPECPPVSYIFTAACVCAGHPFYVIVQNDGNNFPYVFDLLDDRPILRRYVDEKQVCAAVVHCCGTV